MSTTYMYPVSSLLSEDERVPPRATEEGPEKLFDKRILNKAPKELINTILCYIKDVESSLEGENIIKKILLDWSESMHKDVIIRVSVTKPLNKEGLKYMKELVKDTILPTLVKNLNAYKGK